MVVCAVLILTALATGALCDFAPSWTKPQSISAYRNATLADGAHGTLYAVEAAGYSDGPIIVADLHGSHYDVGYLYVQLLANEVVATYTAFFYAECGNDTVVQEVLELFLDWQYRTFLLNALPQDYQDELQGVFDAALDASQPEVAVYVQRTMTVASIAVGDVAFDIEQLVLDELFAPRLHALLAAHGITDKQGRDAVVASVVSKVRPLGRTCSMVGVWGSRTSDGVLYTGRNLDWEAQTGISSYKTVTVYHIPNKHVYASVGFAGLIGSITGMSAAGLTVHEAGDDSKLESLRGFAWSLRLRYVMENAQTLAEAKTLWAATNNTMGINHGIGSASDSSFLAMETDASMTAYFADNDPREAALTLNGTQYGFPLPEALWRTNHGYDPVFRNHTRYGASSPPDSDSFTRYMLIHDTIVQYATANTAISDMEALNITAVVGDKGSNSFVNCTGATDGENVVSAVFVPGQSLMYLAFENGKDSLHVPACCNNYVQLDMSMWFKSE